MLNNQALFDLTTATIWPLSKGALTAVISSVTSFYNDCKDDVKFVVRAMSIKMKLLVVEGTKGACDLTASSKDILSDLMMG